MSMTSYRDRAISGQHDAADQQPWRCKECNEPVSHIRRNPCRCIREAQQATETKQGEK